MTRETWRRARGTFDRAWREYHGAMLPAWRATVADPAAAVEEPAERVARGA